MFKKLYEDDMLRRKLTNYFHPMFAVIPLIGWSICTHYPTLSILGITFAILGILYILITAFLGYWDMYVSYRKNKLGIKPNFPPTPYEQAANLVKTISEKCGYERGAICGYDLMMGFEKGNCKERREAWHQYLKDLENGKKDFTQELRDSAWVPAIFISN